MLAFFAKRRNKKELAEIIASATKWVEEKHYDDPHEGACDTLLQYENQTLYKYAKAILHKFGHTLEEPWTGIKPVWHVWHSLKPLFFITYEQYLNRIIEIYKYKPDYQTQYRFDMLKPVQAVLPDELVFWGSLFGAVFGVNGYSNFSITDSWRIGSKVTTIINKNQNLIDRALRTELPNSNWSWANESISFGWNDNYA